MDLDKLKSAVLQSGFSLEWQTASIFHGKDFYVRQNLLFTSFPNDGSSTKPQVEIDVLAESKKEHADVFAIECKGTHPDNCLVLVESPGHHEKFPTMYVNKESVFIDGGKEVTADHIGGPYDCYTGDFFSPNSERIRADDKTNIYKGLIQLSEGVSAYCEKEAPKTIEKVRHRIIPAIVTNAEIWVARFSKDNSPSKKNPTLENVPWVIYRNSVSYGVGSHLGLRPWQHSGGKGAEKKLPLVWIINVAHLNDFIAGDEYTYKRFWIANPDLNPNGAKHGG